MRIRSGLELGIRAEMEPVIRAAEIARKNELDYFLVPETHPKMAGVNAFDALERISGRGGRTKIGTGIVSVHSRYKHDILREMRNLCPSEDTRIVLGIGASTKALARMWGFEKKDSLSKLREYTMHVKYNMLEAGRYVDVLWGVSRDKAKRTAASNMSPVNSAVETNPDGIILHMETAGQVTRTINTVKTALEESRPRRSYSKFEVAAIRLVYFEDGDSGWRDSARRTIANYVANNPGYAPGLIAAGLADEVESIRNAYDQTREVTLKLDYASKEVTEKMLEALTTHGTPKEAAEGLYEYGKKSGAKTVIAGIDMGRKDYYRSENIKNLEELAQNLNW